MLEELNWVNMLVNLQVWVLNALDLDNILPIHFSGHYMNDRGQALIEIKKQLIKQGLQSSEELDKIKRKVSRKYHLKTFPKNSEILFICNDKEKELLLPILMIRKVRTLSGVAVVAAMTRPWECPHGQCIMCPGGPEKGKPQSYTGYEPTTMRGIRNNYDPYLQVQDRVKQLEAIGHSTEKVDVIVMGGTFTHQPSDYQEWFIKRLFDGLNEEDAGSILEAHKKNETTKHRCVGLTVETRPDQIDNETIDSLLNYGVTRLEIGVQTVFDDVFKKMNRGHGSKEVIHAFQLIKDSGLKITAHMMPGLPGSDLKRDLEAFFTLFNDEKYKPDEIKIYPTMVIPGTKLYEDYKSGRYEPLTNENTASLISEIKKLVPPYVRVKRVLRDIPAHQIAAGPNKSDLRLDAQRILHQEGKKCRCIRCREIGHYLYKGKGDFDSLSIAYVQRSYTASGGTEHFLSFEEVKNDVLIGFLRLRELSQDSYRPEFQNTSTILVRELHIYGESLALKSKVKEDIQWQHRGYGKELLTKAEEIGREKEYSKIAVISGIGVREYYHKFGYTLDGPYMSKKL